MCHRLREQARSHTGYCGLPGFDTRRENLVGASLLAKALDQAMKMLNVPTPSRASPLPHWILWVAGIWHAPRKPCGSEPARECIRSGDEDVGCATAFASRLAPTRDIVDCRDLARAAKTCGSGLARESVGSGDEDVECATAFASRPALTGACSEAQTRNNCRVIAMDVSSDCPVRCNLFSRLAPSQS